MTTTTAAAEAAAAAAARRLDRAAPAGVEDRALRVAGPAELRAQGEGALPGLRDRVRERRPGRREAAAAGRRSEGREGARARPGGRGVRRRDRQPGQAVRDPGGLYDRLITDADIDYYISFDNEKVGKLQGESLVGKLEEDGAKGSIVMINGAPTTTPSCSRRARTASSTAARSRSPRSTTRLTGAQTRLSRRWSRRSRRSARTASWACTPRTTERPAARSRP